MYWSTVYKPSMDRTIHLYPVIEGMVWPIYAFDFDLYLMLSFVNTLSIPRFYPRVLLESPCLYDSRLIRISWL